MRPAYTAPLSYGSRGRRPESTGVRPVAPTFGKTRFSTYSTKAAGAMDVEYDAELLVTNMLTLDPGVRAFAGQPFTVDLIDRRILRSREAVSEARKKHRLVNGPKFYTPDFAADCFDSPPLAVEVKLEGFLGDDEYAQKLTRVQSLLEAAGYHFLRVIIPSNPWHPLRVNLGLLADAALRQDLWPNRDEAAALETVCGEEGSSLGDVCNALNLSADFSPAWLVSGVIAADLLRNPINFDLHVTPAHGDLGHLAMVKELAQ